MKKTKTPAKKTGKKSTAVAKRGASTTMRPSRLNKFSSKISKLGTGKVSAKALAGLQASVVVTMDAQPVQIFGTIIESNDTHVVLRTQKKSGSTKPAIKTYLRNRVVSQIGTGAGDEALLTVLDTHELLHIRDAAVQLDGTTAIVTDNKTGDTMEINRAIPGVNVDIQFDEA
ncbi:hypothetical protein BN7874_077 [Phage NCTB]|nr:hypothetical protein BN7874_077 [Phage NCTB]